MLKDKGIIVIKVVRLAETVSLEALLVATATLGATRKVPHHFYRNRKTIPSPKMA